MPDIRVWHCTECSVDWNNLGYVLDACPKCEGENLVPVQKKIKPIVTEDDVTRYIEGELSKADGYIVSDMKCIGCGGGHYMVWPGQRSETDYNKVTPLLQLPQCPIRVWRFADPKGIGMPLEDFIRSLKVKEDE